MLILTPVCHQHHHFQHLLMEKNANTIKVFVISFTIFFMIDQYYFEQGSLVVTLFSSVLSGLTAALIFIFLKAKAEKKREGENNQS